MPRVRARIPDELLQRVATAAQQQGSSVDDLYGEAVERYLTVNANASPGSLRSRSGIPAGSPTLTIEIPEDLFQRAEKLAKRLGRKRDVLCAEALPRHMARDGCRQRAEPAARPAQRRLASEGIGLARGA